MRPLLAIAALLAVGSTGCFTTHIRSGRPAAPGEPALDKVLRSQVVGDVVVIDPPDKLPQRCPDGWSRIDTEVTPFNWLLDFVGGWFYHANTVTLRCATPGAPASVPAASAAVPPGGTPPAPAVLPPPLPPPATSAKPTLPPPPPGFTPM